MGTEEQKVEVFANTHEMELVAVAIAARPYNTWEDYLSAVLRHAKKVEVTTAKMLDDILEGKVKYIDELLDESGQPITVGLKKEVYNRSIFFTVIKIV